VTDATQQKKRDIFLRKSDDFHIAIDRYTPKTLKAAGVVIHFMEDGKLTRRIDTNRMTWLPQDGKWRLETYAIREFHPDGFETAVHFSRKDTVVTVNFSPEDLTRQATSPQEKNYSNLKTFIAELNESGVDTTRWKVNLYGKISFAFTNVIVVLFAFPLVAFKPRHRSRLWCRDERICDLRLLRLYSVRDKRLVIRDT
jgi:lipopolysaccharide export LptBFGC system permease protein LptF